MQIGRANAISEVAARRGVTQNTIRDACVRRLNGIELVADFDELLSEFEHGRAGKMEHTLLRSTVDREDPEMIRAFFSASLSAAET